MLWNDFTRNIFGCYIMVTTFSDDFLEISNSSGSAVLVAGFRMQVVQCFFCWPNWNPASERFSQCTGAVSCILQKGSRNRGAAHTSRDATCMGMRTCTHRDNGGQRQVVRPIHHDAHPRPLSYERAVRRYHIWLVFISRAPAF